jgi:hypothetical protein
MSPNEKFRMFKGGDEREGIGDYIIILIPKHIYVPFKPFKKLDSTLIVLSLIVLSICLQINVLHNLKVLLGCPWNSADTEFRGIFLLLKWFLLNSVFRGMPKCHFRGHPRYCPARWIMPKVGSFDRPFLKETSRRFFEKSARPPSSESPLTQGRHLVQ